MSRAISYVPRVAIFLAGAATAALTIPRRERGAIDPALDNLKKSIADLEARIQSRESADTARLEQIETRLEAHSVLLADVPSTSQIIAAMEQLLSRTMAALDERLSSQARSIDTLKAAVAQSDGLLERVIESLDTLQRYPDAAGLDKDSLLSRPAV